MDAGAVHGDVAGNPRARAPKRRCRPGVWQPQDPLTLSRFLTVRLSHLLLPAAALVLAACSTPMNMGSTSAKTTATGSTGGSTSTGANEQLERCPSAVGTVSFIEDTSAPWYYTLTGTYGLPSTTMVLRMLAQQSNCFIVVERGRGFQAMEGERRLAESGELRGGSNFGKGQVVSADYAITPSIVFSAGDTGGISGSLGGLSRHLGVLGAVAGGVRQREASTMLALTDNRSGVQLAMAEGSASTVDINASGWGFGLPGAAIAGLGAYSRTPQGKVLVAAFTDSFNQLVRAVRTYQPQRVEGQRSGTGGKLRVE